MSPSGAPQRPGCQYQGERGVTPELAGSDVPVMEEVGIGVYSPEHHHKNSQIPQQIDAPCRPDDPCRLLSSARKDDGENDQHGPRKCKRGVRPTNPVARVQPKQEQQDASHCKCKKRVIPKAARLGKRNHRAKYSRYAQETGALDLLVRKTDINPSAQNQATRADRAANQKTARLLCPSPRAELIKSNRWLEPLN
jgi:hypothetical protein